MTDRDSGYEVQYRTRLWPTPRAHTTRPGSSSNPWRAQAAKPGQNLFPRCAPLLPGLRWTTRRQPRHWYASLGDNDDFTEQRWLAGSECSPT